MPFVPANGIVRTALNFEDTAGNVAVNVLHFRALNTPIVVGNLFDLNEGLEAWANAYWDTAAVNQWRLTTIESRDLSTEEGVYHVLDTNVVGIGTDNAMSPVDTVAISLRSNFTGRSRRGRLYHVGLGEGAQDGGYLSETAITLFTSVYEQIITTASNLDFEWGVLSYVADGAPRVTPLFTPITSVIITDPIVDHMLKRKPRG